jgi:salicylate hydroxylase
MPESPESWRPLTSQEGAKECSELAKVMKKEGWSSIFTDCLESATSVLRTGLRARSPIPVWHAPEKSPRVFLLGDAAHPPVPYIGQGAMV